MDPDPRARQWVTGIRLRVAQSHRRASTERPERIVAHTCVDHGASRSATTAKFARPTPQASTAHSFLLTPQELATVGKVAVPRTIPFLRHPWGEEVPQARVTADSTILFPLARAACFSFNATYRENDAVGMEWYKYNPGRSFRFSAFTCSELRISCLVWGRARKRGRQSFITRSRGISGTASGLASLAHLRCSVSSACDIPSG